MGRAALLDDWADRGIGGGLCHRPVAWRPLRAEAGEPGHLAQDGGWFTEGFDTADLRDAKLLDQLSTGQHELVCIARCSLPDGAAKLCQRPDKRDQSHVHFTTATTMNSEMGTM